MSDPHSALHALRNRLGRASAACEDVDMLTAQAIAYVWGWQDRGGAAYPTVEGAPAELFGPAYGVVVARSYLYSKARPAIQDAWLSWCESGEIRAYGTGPRLDVYTIEQEPTGV